MMVDVNALSRYNGTHPLILLYERIAASYAALHKASHPWAFEPVNLCDINHSGSVSARRKRQRSAPTQLVSPVTEVPVLRLGLSIAPVHFTPMPVLALVSTGADTLPLNNALHSLKPWWLTVDSLLSVTLDALWLVHCQAETVYVATDKCNCNAIRLQQPQADGLGSVASFAGSNLHRPLFGADFHYGRRSHQGQLKWVWQVLLDVVGLREKFELPYFFASLPACSGIVPSNVRCCVSGVESQ